MAGSTKIKVLECPVCRADNDVNRCWCQRCSYKDGRGTVYKEFVERDKIRITDTLSIVDWFTGRSSAGLIVEDTKGQRYEIYMSDIFRHLGGKSLGRLTLEETKKGTAYGWKIIDEEAA